MKIRRIDLDPTLFPGLPTNAEVHRGFAIQHKKKARQILAEVERLMDEYSSTHVILVRVHNCLTERLPLLPSQ